MISFLSQNEISKLRKIFKEKILIAILDRNPRGLTFSEIFTAACDGTCVEKLRSLGYTVGDNRAELENQNNNNCFLLQFDLFSAFSENPVSVETKNAIFILLDKEIAEKILVLNYVPNLN